MQTRIAITALLVAVASPAFAQDGSSDVLLLQHKRALIAEAGEPLPVTAGVNTVVPPSNQTDLKPRFGYRLIVGAPYNPTIYPTKTWIWVACESTDPRVAYDDTKFGSPLVWVHALVYALNADGSINTVSPINTVNTFDLDEGLCNLSNGISTTYIEVPRSFNAQVVTLLSAGNATQYVEVTHVVERALPRTPEPTVPD